MDWWRRTETLAGAAALAVAILLGTPSTSAAARSRYFPLVAGQGVTVSGSRTWCRAATDSEYGLDLKGKTYVVCGTSTESKPAGYVALMESDGRVVIVAAHTQKTVSTRSPTAVAQAAGPWTAHLGDQIVLGGEPVICAVITLDNKATVLCSFFDRSDLTRPRPNTYAFAINNARVSSIKWDAQRNPHILQEWPEP